jgi:hypothetical protein
MTKIPGRSDIGLLGVVILVVIAAATVLVVASQSYNSSQNNGTYPGNIVLNIYIDEGGKALITGYADSIDGLPFLKGSQFKYDNKTKQLYALTNSLTDKSGDDWESTLPTQGNYSEYHSIFYLPASVRISRIDSSPGLDYLLSAANDSFQVDFHGYDVKSPTITMDYQLPLQEASTPSASNNSILAPLATLLGLSIVSASLFYWFKRRGASQSSIAVPHNMDLKSQTGEPRSSNVPVPGGSNPDHGVNQTPAGNEQSEPVDSFVEVVDIPNETRTGPSRLDDNPIDFRNDTEELKDKSSNFNSVQHYGEEEDVAKIDERVQAGLEPFHIEITSEMAAIMETLTARERAVLSTLIEHNGKMNQADIRYETSIPKSSLTGILLSLERRKLITKKEKGRTNAIELSDWFLSRKESFKPGK